MTEPAQDKPRILYVDDEKENLISFKYIFKGEYEIHLATSPQEAYEKMLRHPIQIVIADQKMPGETGVAFLERILPEFPDTVRMIVTGYSDMEAVIHAINRSKIHYYFQKPWNEDEMKMVIDDALRACQERKNSIVLLEGLERSNTDLARKVTHLERKVEEKTRLLEKIRQSGEQLSLSEERLRAIFEVAQDCIFIKDASLKYTQVNPAMLKFLDADAENIIGHTDADIFARGVADEIRNMELRVLKGQAIEAEHTIDLNGSSMTLSSSRMPMRDSVARVTGICGIIRDVTGRRESKPSAKLESELFKSAAMSSTLRKVLLAAKNETTVLFLGESGSGKDYLAKYLHGESNRSGGPFFTINCAALAPELADSELFGHESGAFTGARGRKRGLLELAEGGTLLLNEIGELPIQLQAKLLTFLDTQSFTRVGGEKYVTVNARLIAATNRDLEIEVQRGNFRNDLFYRLNVFPIKVPPLRDRIDDLPILLQHLLASLSHKLGVQKTPHIDPGAMDALKHYDWPGNVRELENVLERAIILSNKGEITRSDLTMLCGAAIDRGNQSNHDLAASLPEGTGMNEILRNTKYCLVSEALHRCGGSIKNTASLLGISRGSLKHYLKHLNIPR
ncbi:MAG: sigma 54-interacting transcriptional regulator [Desulfomonile tiedjei]|uniref:Sigma 54-interacting transcriptional regulator n=1 Tax=Desulfomonile tiedjei TaxID=2358 RepID=A0A9D6V406_9BACT|nr:sigma 54-interacting transcriptional regulator [Desulfomonile tiedjei]